MGARKTEAANVHHSVTEMIIIIAIVAIGLISGFTGVRGTSGTLPEQLRPYDRKMALVQLCTGIIGIIYLAYYIWLA